MIYSVDKRNKPTTIYILEIFVLKPGQTGPTSMRVNESRQSRIVRGHFKLHTERIKE